ncbi:thiopeptide-type bacteriocin biosynthesis protein [Algoriphagus aquimarinus]|uniref:Thiopeptide-type bacteriocin biosynthesis domain-containing protein n=1 Tax=Algoriphagus aquimarinus TaxID=237018 RepID=A0A5C7AA63_9BACT|nr:thiopeptide-type bacteriocin biosynthesis protein [Algoriphagus aquimarinus]TXE01606.1 hypothetical protein ESV85_22040 [Algoriphagus aquimarinus]
MDFLFRTPLLTFDPRNQKDVEKNWEQIMRAITYSSPDFALGIKGKKYSKLTVHQQEKLLKYLLRGRYRATPFGYWAAVGLGNWGLCYSQPDLNTKPIKAAKPAPNISKTKSPSTYCLPVGFKKNKHHYLFWSFDEEKEGWLAKFIETNKVLDKVIEWYYTNAFLDFDSFCSWFDSSDQRRIKTIWEKLIMSGILVAHGTVKPILKDNSIDLKIKNTITIPIAIKNRLEVIPNEMGALFTPVATSFLESFKTWFITHFDDRFVRMDRLMQHKDFWPATYDIQNTPSNSTFSIPGTFWEYGQVLDLSRLIEKKEVRNMRHLQAMFRIGKDEEIQLENFACNYPYAFMGRFGKDSAIHTYFRQSGLESRKDTILYADVLLKEAEKSLQLSSHTNLFDYSIDSFGAHHGKNILHLTELWLGISEGKEFVLYSESLAKQVIPVIQHPLNPMHISHPVSRIVWHIAQQDVLRFMPYYHSAFQAPQYTPRLMWGEGMCVQPEKWILKAEDLKNYGSLGQLISKWQIPELIAFGNYDRELLLDTRRSTDRNIIEKELLTNGKCHVKSAEWVGQSPIHTGDKAMIYPQIIKSWKFEMPYPKLPSNINYQRSANSHWIYLKVHLVSPCREPFMNKTLRNLISRVTTTGECTQWFFLYYATIHEEIRIRFHLKNLTSKSLVKEALFHELEENHLVLSYNFEPYFPEVSKFGSGMAISEKIFGIESEFILSELSQIVNFRKDAVEIVAELYTRLFLDHHQADLIFKHLKEIKSRMRPDQKRILRVEFDYSPPASYQLFADKYLYTMKKHSFYGELAGLPMFLFHHIHLFINRIYLHEAKDTEATILFLVYRKMGKAMAIANQKA